MIRRSTSTSRAVKSTSSEIASASTKSSSASSCRSCAVRTAASASTIDQPQLRLRRGQILLRFAQRSARPRRSCPAPQARVPSSAWDSASSRCWPSGASRRIDSRRSFSERLRSPFSKATSAMRDSEYESSVRVADLGEQLAGQLVGPLGRFELLPHAMEQAKSEQRLTPRARTAALVGQLDRLVDQTLGLVELEPDDVRLGQRLRGDGLEILAAGGERDGKAPARCTARPRPSSPASRRSRRGTMSESKCASTSVSSFCSSSARSMSSCARAVSPDCLRTASPSAVSASASISASPSASAWARTFSISTDDRGQVAEPPDRARGVVAAP